MKLTLKLVLMLAIITFLTTGVALAQPEFSGSGTLTVFANVINSCSVNSTELIFDGYRPATQNAYSPLDSQTEIMWTCTNGTEATITLGLGQFDLEGNPDFPNRTMTNGSDHLQYSLYQDPNRFNVWGATELSGVKVEGNGGTQWATIYGRIPAGQNVPSGFYQDSVVISMIY